MAAEIKSIFGTKVSETGVNQELIDSLERLLEEVRRGEVITIAIAWLDGAGVANSQVVGSGGYTAALGGAIGMLKHRFFDNWRRQNGEQD